MIVRSGHIRLDVPKELRSFCLMLTLSYLIPFIYKFAYCVRNLYSHV